MAYPGPTVPIYYRKENTYRIEIPVSVYTRQWAQKHKVIEKTNQLWEERSKAQDQLFSVNYSHGRFPRRTVVPRYIATRSDPRTFKTLPTFLEIFKDGGFRMTMGSRGESRHKTQSVQILNPVVGSRLGRLPRAMVPTRTQSSDWQVLRFRRSRTLQHARPRKHRVCSTELLLARTDESRSCRTLDLDLRRTEHRSKSRTHNSLRGTR